MADASPWVPVVSMSVGGAFTLLGGLLAQWMTTGRERQAKEREVRENRERLWSDFQIKMLLNLQSKFLRLSDSLADVLISSREYERTGHLLNPGTRMETASRDFYLAKHKVYMLFNRIADEQVRSLSRVACDFAFKLKEFNDNQLNTGTYADDEAIRLNHELAIHIQRAHDRIGEVLRQFHSHT